jgi:hypothetical protein
VARVRISDISGELINEGSGASVRIVFHSDRRAAIELDVTDAELAELFADVRIGGLGTAVTGRLKPSMQRAKEQYPRAYERWTADEDERLRKLFQSGRDSTEIANLFQRQPSAIVSRMRKLGVVP